MKIFYSVWLFSFFSIAQAFAGGDPEFYEYQLQVLRAKSDAPKRLATFLVTHKLDEDCIHLRSTGALESQNFGHLENRDFLVLFTRKSLNTKTLDEMRAALCAGADRNCEVQIKSANLPLYKTYFLVVKENLEAKGRDDIQAFRMLEAGVPPQLTDACKTGENNDSWNRNIGSQEARNYFSKLGADPDSISFISFASEIETLGFATH